MFSCQSGPDIPSEESGDAALASFIVRLSLAHEDCQAQLATVKSHLEINGVTITETILPAHPAPLFKIPGLF
ncbi:MAG: hypothetical protein HKN36_08220 [Hellea sp.]|nr:hypothetical protein [Hellea sp.]